MMSQEFTNEFLAKFDVHGVLGQGGMGVVYRATQKSLDRAVAVKFLAGDVEGADYLRRFELEAKTAAQIFHSNLVAVIEYGQMGGFPYIVFEFVDGESLRSKLTTQGAIRPLSYALNLAKQAAQGLGRAHQAGIIHRDVKPENLLLAGDTLKVADFGVAKVANANANKTGAGMLIGTPAYMSPEQIMEKPLGPASDVYSLGVVLYELVNGRLPFAGKSAMEVLGAHITKPVPPLMDGIPDAVSQIVLKALAKEPEERFANMEEFAASLQTVASALSGEGPAVQSTGGGSQVTAAVSSASGRTPRSTGQFRTSRVSRVSAVVPAPAKPDRRWMMGLGLCAVMGMGIFAGRGRVVPRPSVSPPAAPSVVRRSEGSSWDSKRQDALARLEAEMNGTKGLADDSARNHLMMAVRALRRENRLQDVVESYSRWCSGCGRTAAWSQRASALALEEIFLRLIEDRRMIESSGREMMLEMGVGPFKHFVEGVVALACGHFLLAHKGLQEFHQIMTDGQYKCPPEELLLLTAALCERKRPLDTNAAARYIESTETVLLRPLARVVHRAVAARAGQERARTESQLELWDKEPSQDYSGPLDHIVNTVNTRLGPL